MKVPLSLSYVYKILMNSLYGRSGINPKSTIIEVCNFKRYTDVVSFEGFIHGDMLSENNFIVSYHTNTGNDGTHWNLLKNSAVQLATASTTSARIYMYPYISRDDCYYTDTDTVVLSQPFPEELISSSILGMLKLEDQIVKGFFLAPKAYSYYTLEGSTLSSVTSDLPCSSRRKSIAFNIRGANWHYLRFRISQCGQHWVFSSGEAFL
ncbi:DNA polymerase-like protein [Tanacetum coccineum]